MLAGVPAGTCHLAAAAVFAAVLLLLSLWWTGTTRAGDGPRAKAATRADQAGQEEAEEERGKCIRRAKKLPE